MSGGGKKGKGGRKVRVEFRRNRGKRTRRNDLTRDVGRDGDLDRFAQGERVSGKGELSRRRTVVVAEGDDGTPLRDIDTDGLTLGLVVSAVGLHAFVEPFVEDADGRVVPTTGETYECTVRRVLRTLARDGRNAVVTGDHVLVRVTAPAQGDDPPQAVIERVEPRRGVISRLHHNREHVIAANVDQAAIVTAAADPPLKPGLIDRFVASCERNRVRPLIVINKVDLVPRDRRGGLAEIALRYHRLGYPVVPASVPDGRGVDRLRRLLAGRVTVFSGQSGVGKSSLLNAVHDGLGLKTSEVSGVTGKGTHTTRRAVAMPLPPDARVIDTPGIRQFDLWGEDAGELEAYFVEFRPFIPHCRFPDCTHTHETGCAVKQAVEDGLIAKPRYESYVRMFEGDD